MHIIAQFLWGKEMILILLGMSLYFMFHTKFVLFIHPLQLIKGFKNKEGFSSLCHALGSSLGVGSISGVASALTLGGSGALIWMMISAVFGMMLKYIEILAGLKVQRKVHNQYLGGCIMVFHDKKLSLLGIIFSICCIGASFGIGNLVPMQAMKDLLIKEGVLYPYIAMAFGLILWICLNGGGKRIIHLNEQLVPLACVCYVCACGYLLLPHLNELPFILRDAWSDAFSWQGIGGGTGGYIMMNAMRYGVARGVFSHEAGMGSSVLAYTSQKYSNHHQIAILGVFEVFFDTLVVCFLSALVLLSNSSMQLDGSEWMLHCFMNGFGRCGGILFGTIVVLFAFPCMLGWFSYGSICMHYLSTSQWLHKMYQLLFVTVAVSSFFYSFNDVFSFCDVMNGLMIVPNLISLLILRKDVIKCRKEHFTKG